MEQKIATIKKLICTEEGEHFWFAKKTDGTYEVYNQIRDEYLGKVERMRVGKFMHWCWCPEGDCFFTNGCLKEMVKFITKLYSKKK